MMRLLFALLLLVGSLGQFLLGLGLWLDVESLKPALWSSVFAHLILGCFIFIGFLEALLRK